MQDRSQYGGGLTEYVKKVFLFPRKSNANQKRVNFLLLRKGGLVSVFIVFQITVTYQCFFDDLQFYLVGIC